MKRPVKRIKPGQERIIPPERIAKYGHIASLLRELMFARDMDAGDLNQALGHNRSHATVYQWLTCHSGPGPELQAKLSKLFGVPAERFARRDLATTEKAVAVRKAEHVPQRLPANSPALAFTVAEDGTARLRLDVTMPVAQGVTLLRLLLDAGMVVSAPG